MSESEGPFLLLFFFGLRITGSEVGPVGGGAVEPPAPSTPPLPPPPPPLFPPPVCCLFPDLLRGLFEVLDEVDLPRPLVLGGYIIY